MPRGKLTPERQERFMQGVRMGATRRLCCLYAGISTECLSQWLKRAKRGEKDYMAFADALYQSEGVAAMGWLAKIEKAASDGAWQAAVWKLERLYPDEYGKQVMQHQGVDGGPIQHQHQFPAVQIILEQPSLFPPGALDVTVAPAPKTG